MSFKKEIEMRLSNKNCTLFIDEQGATITRFQINASDILFPQQDVNIEDDKKLRGGVPLMCPWVGPSEYGGPQHGFIRDATFESKQFVNEGSWQYAHKGRYLSSWRWHFYMNTGVKLLNRGYSQWASVDVVTSVGEVFKMPVNFGFHPYFPTYRNSWIAYTIRGRSYSASIDRLARSRKTKFYKLSGKPNEIILIDTGAVENIKITCTGFSHIALWTDNYQYVCFEPICSLPKDFDTPRGVFLAPDESKRFVMSIESVPNL